MAMAHGNSNKTLSPNEAGNQWQLTGGKEVRTKAA
jgi:hypothetical protein